MNSNHGLMSLVGMALALMLMSAACAIAKSPAANIKPLPLNELSEYDGIVPGNLMRGWELTERSGLYVFLMSEQPLSVLADSVNARNIFAYCAINDHGGLLQKFRMRDFANEVYWPEFIYDESGPADADQDGAAEYYIVYYVDSDGLDAKSLKVLVYWNFKKYKAIAYYPAGNPEDRYTIELDREWGKLPKPIAEHALHLLAKCAAPGNTHCEIGSHLRAVWIDPRQVRKRGSEKCRKTVVRYLSCAW